MEIDLPPGWQQALRETLRSSGFARLQAFVDAERDRHAVYPPADQVFTAFRATPLHAVRAVLLGQDPYARPGQAHGLCFSVPVGVPRPPSLRNILRELEQDLGDAPAPHGCLDAWARRGVLLLNAILTVRDGEPLSHRGRGWEELTDAAIQALNRRAAPVVFLLWGQAAQQKARWIDRDRHAVLPATHPSPLSAHRGFFGSRPFSSANEELKRRGQPEIDWRLEGATHTATRAQVPRAVRRTGG